MSPSNPHRMSLRLVLRASLLALAVLGWAAAPALAAPQVLAQDPEPGAEYHSDAPERVTVTFSEPLDASSEMQVVDECGGRVDDGETAIGGTASNELSIGIAKTVQSTYTVKYVATGVSGTATGNYDFVVHGGKPCDGSGGGGHGGHGGGSDGDGGGSGGGSGHGGHGDNNGDSDGDGGSGGGSEHGGHTGGDGDGMDHDSMSAEEHAQMTGGHGDGHRKDRHGKHGDGKHRDGKHGDHKNTDEDPDPADRPLAAGDDSLPSDIPTGTTVLVSLGLAVVLGMLGGWVLRVSSPS